MKAFFSHSSRDKHLVLAVYEALQPQAIWLDRAEIDWGQVFLERIAEGIQNASDFVLFWSASAKQSDWVRLELNMAFIRALKYRAIRLRVVRLDDTPLPLYLEPYHYLSVADVPTAVDTIVSSLRRALTQPTQGIRHRFLDRNSELGRIEGMINDVDTKVILLHGFQGIGKAALANEALRRFFQGPSVISTMVNAGTGPTELALQLHHSAFGKLCPELTDVEALATVERAMTQIVQRGQFLVFRDTQHWLDDDQTPREPLPTIIRQAVALSDASRNPVFLTSTRRVRVPPDVSQYLSTLHVSGLPSDDMASLLSLWFELGEGRQLSSVSAAQVACELHGHPVAAKLAANLIGQYGVDHLTEFPHELVSLRRDLAKVLIRDLQLEQPTLRLMETLAILREPVPSGVLIDALAMTVDQFRRAVADATRTGIAELDDRGCLTAHALVTDYFWRSHLARVDYPVVADAVAQATSKHLQGIPVDSPHFVALLQAVSRLYFLSGNIEKGRAIRRDFLGELTHAAITHYNRRRFELAESFIAEVLSEQPWHWRMRQYLARIRVRQRRWDDADVLIDALCDERPADTGVQHLRGWRLLRARQFDDALEVFLRVLRERDHVASLRDAAECLYRLSRTTEALEFLERAKNVESDNPYTLDLEARIYEETGDFEKALRAARVAVVRKPHRLESTSQA